jgi:DNA polymerase (family 10)
MDKEQVAAILDEIGTLLEIQGENAFRCNAYHNAARAVEQLETSLEEAIDNNTLGQVRGIGETLRDKITTLVKTGRLAFYEDLRKTTPPGLFQMLRIQGLGPKKVKALYDQLGIDDLEKLKAACEAGVVAKLKGFASKTQEKILEGIEFVSQTGQRVRLDQALRLAEAVVAQLRDCPGIVRMELCGSLRRRRETIKDVDILISSATPGPIMDRFVTLPEVVQVTGHGHTKSSVVLGLPTSRGGKLLINADLRIVRDEQFPLALHHFSGSKEHNVALRTRAQARFGIKLNEYAMTGPDGPIPVKDETEFFRALKLDYIAPELREDTGEIDAAEKHELPDLVELGDLRGTFHCHTDWSDGSATLEEMALAARALGLKYLGIADHSQSLTVANGLTPERVRRQQEEIDRLNERLTGIRLLKGTECDILADGSLDFDEDLLATFDYVVASVHSRFSMSEEEMTERMVRAVSNPYVTMLGHATGRLLLSRDSYRVDLETVLRAAAKHVTMVEINAQPSRLDLDWIHCKRAKALGVQLVINPDAHSTGELELLRYGVDVARRGWLEKKDVFNAKTLAQVTKALKARHDGRR